MRSEVRQLRLVHLEQVLHRQEGQEWVPHWHDEWSIGAIVEGTCHCSVGGRPVVLRAGDLVAIAPGEVHTGALLPRESRRGVCFVMFYVPAMWIDQQGLAAPARSGHTRLPVLARHARCLEGTSAAVHWLATAIPALAQALTPEDASRPNHAPSDAERALLARLQAAVLAGERSVVGLARRCRVSRERIHRVVRQRLGMSPSDYLRAVRLHRAKSLLLQGEPIAAVAADCGFADQAHFTRWFRRTFGYTPGDLAAASARREDGPG